MDDETKDYIERLIAGVRYQIDKEVTYHHGEKCYPSKWIDASILCDVIEREILNK